MDDVDMLVTTTMLRVHETIGQNFYSHALAIDAGSSFITNLHIYYMHVTRIGFAEAVEIRGGGNRIRPHITKH